MNTQKLQIVNEMEREIIIYFQKYFGNNLISLFAEGSYGTYDFVEGYSDYDLLALVKNKLKSPEIDLDALSKKYGLELQCSIKSYEDLQNRIKNNSKTARFIGNLELIKIKKQNRLLFGKNIANLIPNISEIIKRDIKSELVANYDHATSENPRWNIFNREPRKWVNYIINMSEIILLSKGIIVKKNDIPKMLEKNCPDFKTTNYVREALRLRETKEVLYLDEPKKEKLKKMLGLFLEEYRRYVFTIK